MGSAFILKPSQKDILSFYWYFFLPPIELEFKQLQFRVVRGRADHQLGAGGAV